MNSFLKSAFLAVGAAALVTSTAAASSTLTIGSWWGTNATGRVDVTGSPFSNVGFGPFAGSVNGVASERPMYCLDLFHGFHFGNQWEVETFIVPPDPPPPPYNVVHAAWVYNRFGDATTAIEGGAVQIALWEITHETDWKDAWDNGDTWYSEGDFKFVSGDADYEAIRDRAGELLSLVSAALDPGAPTWDQGGTVAYYRPLDSEDYGQGQIVGVPEPTSLLILGVAIAGFGVARRRRRV